MVTKDRTTGAETAGHAFHVGIRRRLQRWCFHRLIRAGMLCYTVLLGLASLGATRRRRELRPALRILLTGRFDSANWVEAHLGPLARSSACSEIIMVSTRPVPEMDKVVGVSPPRWLIRLVGAAAARTVTFACLALRRRPDVLGGFHLLINGLAAILMARVVGGRSMYFCVGGPVEVIDGGVLGEGNYFAMMETPDPVVERRLLAAVAACDLIITMGSRAARYFREHGATGQVHVVSGGIDPSRFAAPTPERSIDVVLTARLVPIKRIDVLLKALQHARRHVKEITAAIVGDGPCRDELQRLAHEEGLADCVRFVGHQSDVDLWLIQSRLFLLTSDSEGLSLSLMEAMMAGLPAVVSDVGDLADLVTHGVNGFIVPRRDPRQCAERIVELLSDPDRLAAFSAAARAAARRYEIGRTVQLWDEILTGAIAA